MTREEEINNEAKVYTNTNGSVYDIMLYKVFCDGAKWADEHPNLSSLWHDANEMPEKNVNTIICKTICGTTFLDYVPGHLQNYKLTAYRWKEYILERGIKIWANISDLLPK